MRGKSSQVLIGVGAFLLVVAVLSWAWAYPKLAVAPIDQDSETTLSATDATIFDIESLSEQTTDLMVTAKTVGDIEASEEAGDDVRVWVSSSSTKDADGAVRSRSVTRAAFDAYSAEAVNCCGEYIESQEGVRDEVEHQGLVFKFPFKTEKKTYDFWDSTLREAVPIEYVGTEEVGGMTTYRFEHTIEPTQVGTLELPADLLGEDGDATLTADRMYSNVRTVWVEPETGAVLDREEQQLSTLQYDGTDRITITEATVTYTDESIEQTVKDVKTKALLLKLLKPIVPVVALVLGVLLLVLGVVSGRRKRSGDASPVDEEQKVTAGA